MIAVLIVVVLGLIATLALSYYPTYVAKKIRAEARARNRRLFRATRQRVSFFKMSGPVPPNALVIKLNFKTIVDDEE